MQGKPEESSRHADSDIFIPGFVIVLWISKKGKAWYIG